MLTDRTVEAGTVLHFDFNELGGEWPEMQGPHPLVVVTPAAWQNNRTVMVVPLTSKLDNFNNPSAVEITNAELARRSPSGRVFAVCNLVVTLSLDRPSLELYGHPASASTNRLRTHRVVGDELRLVRIAVMRQLMPQNEFSDLLRRDRSHFLQRLKERLRASIASGRRSKAKRPR